MKQWWWMGPRFLFAPDDGGGGGGGNGNPTDDPSDNGPGDQGEGGEGETPDLTYDTWYKALDETQKALMDGHTNALKTALDSEREQRKELATQLREATGKLKEGSEARKELEGLTAQLEEAEKRAAFYEEAVKPDVGCANPKLAYICAQEIEAFDRRGNVNWDDLKKEFPELFPKPSSPKGHAGSGTQGKSGKSFDMNTAIRRAAGRTS